ncbi:hypothetical protein Hanom_Chr02g00140661 [Helianthus anomalus]
MRKMHAITKNSQSYVLTIITNIGCHKVESVRSFQNQEITTKITKKFHRY